MEPSGELLKRGRALSAIPSHVISPGNGMTRIESGELSEEGIPAEPSAQVFLSAPSKHLARCMVGSSSDNLLVH
jgi:hypothetical protein